MPRRHNTILHDRVALAPAATPLEKDLPINPLSFLSINMRMLNSVASATPSTLSILNILANVEILLDGKTLVGGSLADIAMMTLALWGIPPQVYPLTKTDNNVINATVHVPFTRLPWLSDEALPTTRKGDLTLRITPAASFVGVDTLTLTVEARQILDSIPKRFLKYTTSTKTPTATGEHELDMLTGPDYAGVLFFGTTTPVTASQNASIAKLKLKVDDVEQMIPETRYESLFGEWSTRRGTQALLDGHIHTSDVAAAYTQFQNTQQEQSAASLIGKYLYLDFDPLKDLSYRLITRGRSRAHFVITADVADAIRMLPVEVVSLVEETAA